MQRLLPVILCLIGISPCRAQPIDETNAIEGPRLEHILIGPPNDLQVDSLLQHPDLWARVRRSVGGLIHADHTFGRQSDSTLRRVFSSLARSSLVLELEVGVIKEWSFEGSKTFDIEAPTWRRIELLGGNFTSIAMDEPFAAARLQLHHSDEYAVGQVAEFVMRVRKAFPRILIGDIEPYPAIAASDHATWLSSLDKELQRRGCRRLDFYRIDPDWNSFPNRGSWIGIKSILDSVRRKGISTSLIYWAARAPALEARSRSNALWSNELIAEAGAVAAANIRVDQIVVESWIGLPEKALPESDPSSFAGSVSALLNKLNGG